MDERILRFRVGVVVLAAAIITVILIMLLGAWPNPFRAQYTVFIEFPEAPGVAEDTPVLKSGIHIGRVAGVELQDSGRVMLTLSIDAKYKLRRSEVCRISTGSLITGDAVLEFVALPNQPPSSEFLTDRTLLTNGVVAGDPFQVLVNLESQIGSAVGSVERAGNQVSQLAENLNRLVGDNGEQLQRLLSKSEVTMERAGLAMESLNGLIGDPELKERIKKAMGDLPELFQDARQTLALMRETLHGIDRASARAERNLANLENLTGPLADRGEQLAADLASSVDNINQLLDQLVQFGRAINSREGSLGQLVHDQELYNRVTRSVSNIEEATQKLRPILNDVRIFTDKISRDPRILGAKGALDRRPSGAGNKWPIR